MPVRTARGFMMLLCVALLTHACSGRALDTGPVPSSKGGSETGRIISGNPASYQALIPNLRPGDTLALQAGSYGGLYLNGINGTPRAPITITGLDSGPRAVILGSSGSDTVELRRCSYLIVRHLEIDSRNLGGDGVNAHGVNHHITIDGLYIHGQGDDQQTVGISSNHAPNWNWIIRNTTIDGAGTGMYLGNSDGANPFVAGLVENNLIMNTVGYNIQFKHQKPWPNSPGIPTGKTSTIIRNNVFSKGSNSSGGESARPLLFVGHWPLSGPGQDNVYEIYGNFFYQNPVEALFQGEGNIAFHHNIMVNDYAAPYPAISIQPHRDVPRMVRIFSNTVVTRNDGIAVTGGSTEFQQTVIGNAVFGRDPISAKDQSFNIMDTYASASSYVTNPTAALGALDLFPRIAKLKGPPIDARIFNAFAEYNRDYNGNPDTGEFRGAYSGEGQNPGPLPRLGLKSGQGNPPSSSLTPVPARVRAHRADEGRLSGAYLTLPGSRLSSRRAAPASRRDQE